METPKKHKCKPQHTGPGEVVCSICGKPCSFAPNNKKRMKAMMTFILDGKEYHSKTTDEITAETMKNEIYKFLPEMEKMEMETDDGFLVFGSNAVQSGVFMFKDIEE